MSVLGLGIDIVWVPGFEEQLRQPGTTFAENFTVAERRDSATGTGPDARHLAARWAAKEAVIKAWSGSRFGYAPVMSAVRHNDIEVVADTWGRPAIRLHGDIAEHLRGVVVHVSLTHDGESAAAVAVLEQQTPGQQTPGQQTPGQQTPGQQTPGQQGAAQAEAK